ncbi:wxcX [Symbiodinium necroappetens]|uniref:WxcX protein n=1 Tax=Symbiodinium necroappetens TaxID=1628268 RepID=A0A812YC65_9DINO|nr:wxcX [Symbiodinium necroappetens]
MAAPSLHGLAMNRMRPFAALCSLLLCKLLAPVLAQAPEGSLLEHREEGEVRLAEVRRYVLRARKARLGLFVQIGHHDWASQISQCLEEVLSATDEPTGVHLNFVNGTAPSDDEVEELLGYVQGKHSKANIFVTNSAGAAADMPQFLMQLDSATRGGVDYDILLKLRVSPRDDVQQLASQALCGTRFHVRSVLNAFASRPSLDLIAPAGTIVDRKTSKKHLAPSVFNKVLGNRSWRGFSEGSAKGFRSLLLMNTGHVGLNEAEDLATYVAGGSFWLRREAEPLKTAVAAIPRLAPLIQKKNDEAQALELALEGFVTTALRLRGRSLATMPPAPKVIAMYYPQFHQVPELEKFFGDGYTDWKALQDFKGEGLRKPLSEERGGLGFYDLMKRQVRGRQAQLAKQHGVHGFSYYHYWFGGEGGQNKSVMWKVPYQVLHDGQPNLPYFFTWANEPWTRKFSGQAGEDGTGTLIPQTYGDREHWEEHFEHLMQYFKDHRYMKIDNKPVFAILRPQLLEQKLEPMLKLWRSLAVEKGFSGLYILSSVGRRFYEEHNYKAELLDGAFHHAPSCRDLCGGVASDRDLYLVKEQHQYWGAATGFDGRVHGNSGALHVTPKTFQQALVGSFANMTAMPQRHVPENLFFVGSWNHWAEQHTLEPDDKYVFGYLQALRNALEHVKPRELEARETATQETV